MDSFLSEFPSASTHERFSIMLQERLLALEEEIHQCRDQLYTQQCVIKHQISSIKICHIKNIYNKYHWQYSNITNSPLYYCKILVDSMEMWCSSNRIPFHYNNISFHIDEVITICKSLFSDASRIRIGNSIAYLNGAEMYKAKAAYLFAIMSIDELIKFDVDDTIPDLIEST